MWNQIGLQSSAEAAYARRRRLGRRGKSEPLVQLAKLLLTDINSMSRCLRLLLFAGLIPSLAGAGDAMPGSASASWRSDFDVLRSEVVMQSGAYSEVARDAALSRIDAVQSREIPLERGELIAELMRISALAQNGHDYFDTGTGWFPDRRLPLRLLWLADGLIVSRTAPEQAALSGSRVLRLGGKTPDEVMAVLQSLDGSLPGYLRTNKYWLLESTDLLHAVGISSAPDRVVIEVETDSGKLITRELVAVPSGQVPMDIGRLGNLSLKRSAQEQELDWRPAVTAEADPFYLREREKQFRLTELPGLDALYIQLRANLDGVDERLGDFAERAARAVAETPRAHLILDERFNFGGNSDLTLDLMRAIGRHENGRIYVLISGNTFSAGIVSTALVKQESGGRAVIVGEPVGDRLRWWSEGHNVCLPYSGYCLHVSTGLWDLVHGCSGEPGCYGDRFGIRVADLDPDLPVPMTIADWRAGRDPLLEAIEKDLATILR